MTDSGTSNQLSTGDVAILLPHAFAGAGLEVYQGQEVVLIAPDRSFFDDGWEVRAQDGRVFGARAIILQKKKPPREDLKVVRWDECPWQPERINV